MAHDSVTAPTARAASGSGNLGVGRRALDARWPLSVAFTLVLVLAWQLLALGPGLPAYILSPAKIVSAFADGVTTGDLLSASRATLARVVPGFVIGAAVGVTLGLIAGVTRFAEDIVDPLVSITYPLPKISLFPLLVIWLGFTDRARVTVIAISVAYPALVNAYAGTKGIDRRFIWVAQNLESSLLRTFRQVILPASLPSILVGLRISLALSFVLGFATEAIGASRTGLGVVIQDGYNNQQYGPMYAAITMFAVLGFLADLLLKLVSRRLPGAQPVDAVGRG